MRKKLLTFSVAAAFVFALAGCGSSGTKSVSNDYVNVKNYNGLQIEKVESTEVTDDEVEAEINSYLEADTEQNEVNRSAKDGDVVNIDYVGKIDGKKFDGGSAEGYDLELGSGTFIGENGDYKSFEEQIIGHKAGEKFDIKVKFPDGYSEDLSGKVATFTITLNKVMEKSTPALDDEWVKEKSESSKTVDEYKAEIKKQLQDSNEEERQSELQSRILVALNDQIEIKKVPEEEKAEVKEQIRSNYESYAASYGMEFSDFISQMFGTTEEQFEEELDQAAEESAAVYVACELIAEKEKLTPTEAQYQESYKEYAKNHGYDDVDEFLKVIDKDDLNRAILQKKVTDFLIENAEQLTAEEMATATTQESSSETDTSDAAETDTSSESDTSSSEADTAEREESTEK